MREERVALEDIAEAAPLGRQVDPGVAVEEDLAVDDDPPASGRMSPARHCSVNVLPAPDGPKSATTSSPAAPVDLEREPGQSLDHLHQEMCRRMASALIAPAPRAGRPRPAPAQDSAVRRPTRTRASIALAGLHRRVDGERHRRGLPGMLPASISVAPNSPSARANARTSPARIPFRASGSVTSSAVRHSDRPSVRPRARDRGRPIRSPPAPSGPAAAAPSRSRRRPPRTG